MLVLVTYDIANDRVRTRLAHKLKDYGKRVQYSVFEADVGEGELVKLHKMLSQVKREADDSIRIYRLCGECKKHIKIWGKGEITEDKKICIA